MTTQLFSRWEVIQLDYHLLCFQLEERRHFNSFWRDYNYCIFQVFPFIRTNILLTSHQYESKLPLHGDDLQSCQDRAKLDCLSFIQILRSVKDITCCCEV